VIMEALGMIREPHGSYVDKLEQNTEW
jgi:hypothetical protein